VRLAELLGPEPVALDELVRQSHLSVADVQTMLLDLELSGRLDRHPGNRVSLRLD
jgi:DNA processing protein